METKAEVWIPLTQGKVAVIDFEDFEKVRHYSWTADLGWGDTWYAHGRAPGSRKVVLLHRVLMDAAPGEMIDHEDRDGLNNRRHNLRSATRVQNAQNKIKRQGASQFKGVCFEKSSGKWRVRITAGGCRKSLGRHTSELDAAIAYDAAAKIFFGEFARLNFPVGVSHA